MKTVKFFSRSFLTLGLVLATADALAVNLWVIPTLPGDTAGQGRAITPDGLYVAGVSTLGTVNRGILYPVGSGSSINVLSADNAQSTIANGIGYRTSGGNTELLVAALTSSGPAEFMTLDGGATWANKRRDTTYSANTMGTANQLGSMVGSDVYYVSSSRDTTSQPIYLSYGTGPWVPTMTYSTKSISSSDRGIMYGVSAIGRAVGRRGAGSSTYGAYVLDYAAGTPTAYYITTLNDGQNGGSTTLGELWSISLDGQTVFGRSFLTGTSGDYHAFKTTLSGFGPGTTQGAVNQLPELPGTGGSPSRAVPYGASADGRFAVGMDYVGTEMAAFWDTGDPNPANWTVTDLTALASALGILDPEWIRLTRAYSVGIDASGAPVVTGIGVWSPDGGTTLLTRGFVMQVPEPASIALAGLCVAALLILRRRK